MANKTVIVESLGMQMARNTIHRFRKRPHNDNGHTGNLTARNARRLAKKKISASRAVSAGDPAKGEHMKRFVLAVAVFAMAAVGGYSMSANATNCTTFCSDTIGGNRVCNTSCY